MSGTYAKWLEAKNAHLAHLDESEHHRRSRFQRRKNVRGISNRLEDGPRSSQRVRCLGKVDLVSQTVHDYM